MKKFLSLALALVMAVSLVTFGTAGAGAANPASFTDYDSIQYKEAVDVIAALKIIGGYGDNSFRPTGFLSRGAAAKIICNLSLGPEIAGGITAGANSFKDVPSTSSYSGFVSWCVQQKIVSGYNDNTFHPYDNLTGNAYLKMLLGALGYDQTIEGYSGSGWSNNVRIRASQIGLIDSAFDGTQYITREMAALLALRMLQCDEVQYNNTTTVGGKNVATPRPNVTASDGNIDTKGGDGIYQFAEDHFKTLEKRVGGAAADAFSRPATSWSVSNKDVGTYLAEAVSVYYTDVTSSRVYQDLGLDAAANVAFISNGVDTTKAGSKIVNTGLDASKKLSAMTTEDIIGNGTVVSVFYDAAANVVTFNAIASYAGKITSVRSASTSRARSVVVTPAAVTPLLPAGTVFNNVFETDSFNADDVVAYTYSVKDNAIESVEALDNVQGPVARYVANTSLTMGTTNYPYAKMISFGGNLTDETSLNSTANFTIYLLKTNGVSYVLYVDNAAASVDGYALVLKTEAAGTFDAARAKLLFSDGDTRVVTLAENFSTDNVIVRYTVKNSKYTLKAADTKNVSYVTSADGFSIGRNAVSGLEDANTTVTISADARTVFVVGQNDDYKVYTGIKNIPNVVGDAAYTYHENGAARIIFVTASGITTTSRDLVFVAANTKGASGLVHEDELSYREYNVVVNGQITKMKVSANDVMLGSLLVTTTGQVDGAGDCVILNERTINSKGIVIDGVTATTAHSAQGLKTPAADVVTVGTHGGGNGQVLTLSDDINAYKVDANGVISDVSNNLRSISTDSDDWVFYTYEDATVTNLFVVEFEE